MSKGDQTYSFQTTFIFLLNNISLLKSAISFWPQKSLRKRPFSSGASKDVSNTLEHMKNVLEEKDDFFFSKDFCWFLQPKLGFPGFLLVFCRFSVGFPGFFCLISVGFCLFKGISWLFNSSLWTSVAIFLHFFCRSLQVASSCIS